MDNDDDDDENDDDDDDDDDDYVYYDDCANNVLNTCHQLLPFAHSAATPFVNICSTTLSFSSAYFR